MTDRPRVTLKVATSLDGRIATRSGHSKWITGPEARARVHKMRSAHDCVLTGIGTVLADDPELTARLEPAPPSQPLRAVLDSRARTPASSKLMTTQGLGPVCLFHSIDQQGAQEQGVHGAHYVQIDPNADETGLDLHQVLQSLQARFQVKTVMVEAGAQVAGSFMRAGLVDTLVWFRAPIIIGGDGLSVFSALNVDTLPDALVFDCLDIIKVGVDVMETYHARLEA
jgi:diaminohydroxyphosphoribosylaminopyrimidine deaminase / 5-amino-6-(5-phosphoribosylamino)uracil reductase